MTDIPQQIVYEADNKFHLQRMALEAAGYGEWRNGPWGIPVVVEPTSFVRPTKDGDLNRYAEVAVGK